MLTLITFGTYVYYGERMKHMELKVQKFMVKVTIDKYRNNLVIVNMIRDKTVLFDQNWYRRPPFMRDKLLSKVKCQGHGKCRMYEYMLCLVLVFGLIVKKNLIYKTDICLSISLHQ